MLGGITPQDKLAGKLGSRDRSYDDQQQKEQQRTAAQKHEFTNQVGFQ